MNIRPLKIICLSLMIILCLGDGFRAKTIVFPFQVHTLEKKNHQWLGRAISFYISIGLELNSIEPIADSTVQSILNTYNIPFPFIITKATCMKLSNLFEADYVIWGEVVSSENPQTHNVQIKTYIIDLKHFSQKYLPLLKFHLIDFYVVQRELLNMVLNYFQKKPPQFPELNLDYHHYEMFIKSLLLEDSQKKLALLERVYRDIHDSDYLNFELAKCHLTLGNIKNTDHYANKISDSTPFQYPKDFIRGLVYYHNHHFNQAIDIFIELQKLKIFFSETTNNLGVIFLKNDTPSKSESYFIDSIQSKKDPEVYVNYIKLLLDLGKNRVAKENLKQALIYFPDDENLIRFFSYFLSQEKTRKQLFSVFQKYIPQLSPSVSLPDVPYAVKNPFELQTYDNYYHLNTFDSIMNDYRQGNIDRAINKSQELMETNPFVTKLHQLLSEMHLKKNNQSLSKLYALSAEYL
ncbi:MAG: hypothetical protein KAT17_07945, partial [Candidatus Aminicenantes bacterium]|nr:hypothetical protein [Candidatus Aminicenantes bacterium]